MTDPTNAPDLRDVILRLDRLEMALHKLIDVVSRQGSPAPSPTYAHQQTPQPQYQAPAPQYQSPPQVHQAAPPAPRIEPPARPEPPVIEVTPAQYTPPSSTPVGLALEPRRDYDPYGFRTDIVVPPASANIQQVLTAVFEAGLKPEPEDTWAMMTKLTHASQMVGPRALDHFKAFAWHKLRRTSPTYLKNNDPSSFVIAYTDPAEPTPEVDRVRVFVKAGENRMPVPVAFARDATQNGAWRLTMISL
ncbi:MAG: hypothetical protein U1F43_24805 [Myxococcota bacterium]